MIFDADLVKTFQKYGVELQPNDSVGFRMVVEVWHRPEGGVWKLLGTESPTQTLDNFERVSESPPR